MRVRYLYEGAGPPLVLLHGVGLSADIFLRNIDALARDFSVFALDLPGHGFSDPASFDHGSPQRHMAQYVIRFADLLRLRTFAVLGHSFGGLVAGLIHFEAPGRLNKLIIVSSGSAFHPAEEQVGTLRAAASNANKAMSHLTLDACRRRLTNICFDPASVPEELLLMQLTSYAFPGRSDAYKATIEGAIRSLDPDDERIFARLERITLPCLVIAGRQDIRARFDLHEQACRRMPDARLAIFERCGHLPFLEHAAKFNDVVREFLLGRQDEVRRISHGRDRGQA